jgi:hypothetical protein
VRRTIHELLADIGVRLNRYTMGEHRTACPQCAIAKARRDDDALNILIDEKGFQLKCWRCSWTTFGFYDVDENHTTRRPKPKPIGANGAIGTAEDLAEEKRRAAYIARILAETTPAAGTPVETYLRSRGITILPEAIRCHPGLPHRDLTVLQPAMVVAMVDIHTNEAVGLHRTWLKRDGSGKITRAKSRMMFGRARGTAMKLTPDDVVEQGLAIAEGIETALAAMQDSYRVWALGSAGAVADFPLLDGIESLVVFTEDDPAGITAAEACVQRWKNAGQDAEVIPTQGNADVEEREGPRLERRSDGAVGGGAAAIDGLRDRRDGDQVPRDAGTDRGSESEV